MREAIAPRAALDVRELSIEFGRTRNLPRMREIAIKLSKPGLTNKAGERMEFQDGLSHLGDVARSGEGADRLEALSILGRIRSQPSNQVRGRISEILDGPAPSLTVPASSLGVAQDREYLARAISLADLEGKKAYLAGFVAGEGPTATKARDVAAAALLAAEADVANVLDLLAEALRDAPVATLDVATSRARRATRALEAVEKALASAHPKVGTEVGPALARVVELSLDGSWSVERPAAVELSNATFAVLLAVVRPNFSCARDPAVFDAIHVLRRLFLPARWPDRTLVAREALASTIREVIALLAAAGLTDSRLRSMLPVLLDDAMAETWLRNLARSTPNLTNEVRHWLERGKALRSFGAVAATEETVLEGIERDLADACREVRQLRRVWDSLGGDVADLVSETSAVLARGVSTSSERIDRVARRLSSLERRRGYEFEYEVGDVIEYAPAEQETSRPIEGVAMVRVVAPKVSKRGRSGIPQLVLKAKVEPV